MNWFCIEKENDKWLVVGPLKMEEQDGKDRVWMNNGVSYHVNHCFKTKGGATKACYRRNYELHGGIVK